LLNECELCRLLKFLYLNNCCHLISFLNHSIDLHPWVKNRMHRASSTTSSLSTTGALYGDLGSALIKEAENFDKCLSHEKCDAAVDCEDQHSWKLKLFLDHLALCSEGGDHPLQATSKGSDSTRDAVFLGTVHQVHLLLSKAHLFLLTKRRSNPPPLVWGSL